MLLYEDALARLLSSAPLVGASEVCSLRSASGRILADDLFAPFDQPAFSASSVDGYAVLSSDLAKASNQEPIRLAVSQSLRAAPHTPSTLAPGHTARIFTGAPVPEGADAVVMQEDVSSDGLSALFTKPVLRGASIRWKGSECLAGSLLLPRRTKLRAGEIGLLAGLGKTSVAVITRPLVALLACGDELVEPSETPLLFGQIYESNRACLAVQVEEAGAQPVFPPLQKDDPDSLKKALLSALSADLIVTIGGASVGDHDLGLRILRELGATIHFWKVAIRPGKPTFFATLQGKPILGLPGNPASASVGFEIFARPFLQTMLGLASTQRPSFRAKLGQPGEAMPTRTHFLRGSLDFSSGSPTFWPLSSQVSGDLLSLRGCQALAILPPANGDLPQGHLVVSFLLSL